jgi:hypothetical protein
VNDVEASMPSLACAALLEGDDMWAVATAADRLGLTEEELFQLAHRRWFGAPVAGGDLDSLMGAYLLRRDVPFWVRALAREVVAERAPDGGRAVALVELLPLAALLAAAAVLMGL